MNFKQLHAILNISGKFTSEINKKSRLERKIHIKNDTFMQNFGLFCGTINVKDNSYDVTVERIGFSDKYLFKIFNNLTYFQLKIPLDYVKSIIIDNFYVYVDGKRI